MHSADIERAKWKAFRLVKAADKPNLVRTLQEYPVEEWRSWQNFGGRTLFQLAQQEHRRAPEEPACREVYEWLSDKLQSAGLQQQELVRAEVVDRFVDVTHVVEKELVVQTPEKHFHKIIKNVPKVTTIDKIQEVEVPVLHTKEQLVVNHVPERRVLHVPKTTIREQVNLLPRPEFVEEHIEQEVPMPRPITEKVVERPQVDFRLHKKYVPGPPEVSRSEEEVDVPYNLLVPRPEIRFHESTTTRTKEVNIPYIEEVEEVVPRYRDEVVNIEVQDKTIVRHIKYCPKFEMETDWFSPSNGSGAFAGPRAPSVRQELREARDNNERLQQQAQDRRNEIQAAESRLLDLRARLEEEEQRQESLRQQVSQQPAPQQKELSPVVVRQAP